MFFKLLQYHDKSNPQIHIIWTENQKYRVFKNLYQSFLDKLFRRENLAVYLNSSTQDINESLWVAIHLHCPIKGQYALV